MDRFDPVTLQVVGGMLLLAMLFVLREFASGALKQAGEEFWLWVRRRTAGGQVATPEGDDGRERGDHTEGCGRDSELTEGGADDGGSPRLLPLGRDEGHTGSTRHQSVCRDAPAGSCRKSA